MSASSSFPPPGGSGSGEEPRRKSLSASSAPTVSAPQATTKSGFLKRKGTWRGSWREFYYTYENGVLAEYSKPGSNKPRKFFSLSQFTVKLASKLTGQDHTFGLFSIAVSRDPVYFLCPDHSALVSWVTMIGNSCGSVGDLDWDSENILFLEALNDGVVLASKDGTIIGINSAFCHQFKYSRSDLMGKNVTELMEQKYAAHHLGYMQKYIDQGYGSFIGKARLYNVKNASGNFVPCEISLGELSKGGERSFIGRFRMVFDDPRTPTRTSGTEVPARRALSRRSGQSDSDSQSMTDDDRLEINTSDPLFGTVNSLVSTTIRSAETSLVDAIYTELKTFSTLLEAERAKSAKQARTIRKLKALRNTKSKQIISPSTDNLVSSSDSVVAPASGRRQGKGMIVIDSSEPIVGHRLASTGGSGAGVYCANVDGWQCVVKELIIKDLPPQQLKLFEFEMQTLESLPVHRNLARYLFHVKTPTKYQLFMTRYDSTLGHVIRQYRDEQKSFTKREVVQYLLDICRGVEILHRHEIIHRDLKSDNIFVEFGRSGEVARLVIGDFDAAKRISLHGQPQTVIGTPGFMAPEILTDTRYGYPADVWSIGMVLFELLCLERPFEKNPMQAMDLIIKKVPPAIDASSIAPLLEPMISLYSKCVEFDPAERPSVAELNRMLIDHFLLCD